MEVQAFFTTFRDGVVMATDGFISATSPKAGDRTMDLQETIAYSIRGDTKEAIVVIDCDSF